MGTYTYGDISVGFSRELSEDEYAAWLHNVRAGRPEAPPCANSSHEGALLIHDRPEGDGRKCCEHFDRTPNAYGFCFVGSDRYDPDGWDIDGTMSGDIGILRTDRVSFEVESGGKVYDLVDAVTFFVESLPLDVTAEGSGLFESEGYHWGIAVRGREVREIDAQVIAKGDPAMAGTVAWALGHVNFTDGTVALTLYAEKHEARIAYTDELRGHIGDEEWTEASLQVSTRKGDAPWAAHFVWADECLTYLDPVTVQ